MPRSIDDTRTCVKRAATLDRWTLASIRQEFGGKRTATLVQQADDLAHLPLPMRVACWGWLSALALELGDRALAAEAGEEEEVAS